MQRLAWTSLATCAVALTMACSSSESSSPGGNGGSDASAGGSGGSGAGGGSGGATGGGSGGAAGGGGAAGSGGAGGASGAGASGGTGGSAGAAGGGGSAGASPSYDQVVLADGPIGYWRLGEPDGALQAASLVGGLVGQVVGNVDFGELGALVNDSDTAASFNGWSACITVDSFPFAYFSASSAFSLEAWIKPSSVNDGTNLYRIISKLGNDGIGGTGTAANGYHLSLDANNVVRYGQLEGAIIPPATSIVTTNAVSTVSFTHVVVTVENQDLTSLYVNNTMISKTLTGEPGSTAGLFAIGCRVVGSGAASDFFPGVIDEVAVYDKVLTPGQVATHYNAGQGN